MLEWFLRLRRALGALLLGGPYPTETPKMPSPPPVDFTQILNSEDWEQFTRLWEEMPLPIDPDALTELLSKKTTTLMYLMLGITYECQCTCGHCCTGCYKKERGRELSLDEIKGVLDRADNPVAVTLFGGEPTLRPELFEIVKYASQKTMFVLLDTNGLLVTRDYAKRLKESGLDLMYVSLDSPVPEEHDAFRGVRGCYDQVMRAVENAREAGLQCSLSSYLTKESFHSGQFHEIAKIAKDIGAMGVRYLLPEAAGHWLRNVGVMLSAEDEKKVTEFAWSQYPFINRDFYFQNQKSSRCWGLQYGIYCYVSPYGDVQPCVFIPLTLGNVRQEPFDAILSRMWANDIYQNEITRRQCIREDKCPMLSMEWRKKYIDLIPPDAKLPYRV